MAIPDANTPIVDHEGKPHYRMEGQGGEVMLVQVADPDEYLRQRNPKSSDEFLGFSSADPKAAKQAARRRKVMESQVQYLLQREEPGVNVNVVRVKDEMFEQLSKDYAREVALGNGKSCDYQPLSTYAHLIMNEKRTIRKPYVGEIGIRRRQRPDGTEFHEILCLEEGYGKR